MPERKGVLNIADEHSRPRNSEGQAVSQPTSICDIPEVSLTAKQGPVPPKRAGAHTIFEPGSSGDAAHKVTRITHFRDLAALLRNFLPFYGLISEASGSGLTGILSASRRASQFS
jgi:hypothetical protein